MKRLFGLFCMMVVVGLTSTSFALDPILIGNFEVPISNDRYDNWMTGDFDETTTVTTPADVVTLDNKAMKLVDNDGGWGSKMTLPLGEYGQTLETNERAAAFANEGAELALDITAFPGEVTDFATIQLFSEGTVLGWGTHGTAQSVPLDGKPHTYIFAIPEDLQAGIPDAIAAYYCNIGLMFEAGTASATFYVDNVWIYPEGYSTIFEPHDQSVDQVFNANPLFVDATLNWKTAAKQDETDPNLILPVHPDIVDQYIFMGEASAADPNLYYKGATGVDPGLTDPNSSYGTLVLNANSKYYWTVVEAMTGNTQTFTPDVSILDDVDPNNIVGPKWNFYTLSAEPEIITQPVSARFPVADASVQFTIDVDSITQESYQWYYSKSGVIGDENNIALSSALGGDTNTLTLTNHHKNYQAYYYCQVWNQATESGGGSKPDVYSNIVSLVVERKVTDYQFDGNLTDGGDGNNGNGIGSPGFVTGVGGSGQALSLDGATQYVEIGSSTDPNTFNNCFPRADLFTDTEDGAGGGLDVGTIMCWVKLDATAADQVSPIMYNANGGWPVTIFQFEIPTDSTAANTNLRTVIWGDDGVLTMVDVNPVWADPFSIANDGQWHMLAAAWDRTAGAMKAYLDGNLLATWGADPSVFSAWDSTMTIGFDGTNYFGGAIDNLKIYNYELTAEEIVDEYGATGCIYPNFAGSSHNSNQLGSSYCKLDLADFADIALNWLNDGFYTPAP